MTRAVRLCVAGAALLGGLAVPGSADGALVAVVTDISPSSSTLDPSDPDGASGGRVNGIATDPSTPTTLYAASEWGGLFKSTDSGQRWTHLDGHVPTATWDVMVDPGSSNRVYATSFFDGRTDSRSGISVSLDGGVTWTRPATAVPPVGLCANAASRAEPAAFGLAIDPDDPDDVYAGTNCGLAVSNDRGATWTFIDPTPADGADTIWDVVVHDGGIIDLCGQDGHRRSTDGGATWTTATTQPLPAGRCSLAVSPDEAWVLFTVVGTTIRESDDGGGSWPVTYANPSAQGRIPFVATNQRSGATYDLWFGDVRLHRGTCTTPGTPAPGGAQRCNASAGWAGPFTRSVGAHDDSGDIAFDPTTASDACPVLFSSDGGVFVNTLTASPGCHTPAWEQPTVTPHALWHFDFEGVRRAGATGEDLYSGSQDDGSFGTTTGGATPPAWRNERCCDGFDVAGDSTRVLNTICCFSPAPATRLFVSQPGYTGASPQINTPPPGNLRGFQQLDSIDNFGPDEYAIVTSSGVFVTADVGASPVVWTQLGAATTPGQACGIQAIRTGSAVRFYLKNGGCNGELGGGLFRYDGTAPGGTWQTVPPPSAGGGFGIYAVDPNDADRIIASHLSFGNPPEMVMTLDAGTTWNALPALDDLMTGGGAFAYANATGPTRFTGFNGYPQPTLVAFDPDDPDILVAGGADSGVFLSVNGGTRWQLVTDPLTPGASGVPHIPRPRYAHFDHDAPGDDILLYLGTQGRSDWRITFQKVLVPEIQVPGDVHVGDVCVGGTGRAGLDVCNTSLGNLVVTAIASSDPEVTVVPPTGGFPITISHDFCFPFRVELAPGAAGPRTADLSITSNDVNFPVVQVAVDGAGTVPAVALTGSGEYGVPSAWGPGEKTVAVCNSGGCPLGVSSAATSCPDFTVVGDPFPADVAPGSCLDAVVAFTPQLPGKKHCELAVASADPSNPTVALPLTARTPLRFSVRVGWVDPHGALGNLTSDGSSFALGVVYPDRPRRAWDLRLARTSFDGGASAGDVDLWRLSPNVRHTFNPAAPVLVALHGGLGGYHFDPGSYELGANIGLSLRVPVGRRLSFELAGDYHVAFTSSPNLEYLEVQGGLEVSF